MRRSIIYTCLIGSLAIFCLTSGLIEAIVMFLLFGIVPGRVQALSAQEMMAFYLSIVGLMVIRPVHKHLDSLSQISHPQKSVS